jgi:hypothetical protein
VAVDAPTALRRLGDQHPGAISERRLVGCGDDDLGQFFDDAELLVAVENVDRGEYLDADVVAVAGRIRDRVGPVGRG